MHGRKRRSAWPRARALASWRPTRHQPEASPSSRVRASQTVAHRAWWESLGLLLGAVDHQATLAADPHRHVAVDHEADAAKHLLLGVAVLGGDQLADPVGEILVVSHRDNHGAWGPAAFDAAARCELRALVTGGSRVRR